MDAAAAVREQVRRTFEDGVVGREMMTQRGVDPRCLPI